MSDFSTGHPDDCSEDCYICFPELLEDDIVVREKARSKEPKVKKFRKDYKWDN